MKRKMQRLIITLLLLLQGSLLLPQNTVLRDHQVQSSEYIKAYSLFQKASAANASGKTDSTAYYIRESLAISLNEGYSELAADNYRLLGIAYDRIPDWENTLRNMLRAGSGFNQTGMHTKEGDVWRFIAEKYFSFEVYKKSIEYSKRSFIALGPEQSAGKASCAEIAGMASFMLGDYSSAVQWFDTALVWFGRNHNSEGIKRSLRGSASSYMKILDASIPMAKLWNNNIGISSALTSRVMWGISGSFALNRYEALLTIIEPEKNENELAAAYNNMGYICFRQELYPRAIGYFTRATDLMKRIRPQSSELGPALANLAICYMNSGEEERGRRLFREALNAARESGASSEMARIEQIMARMYLRDNDFYHAEVYCNDCIRSSRLSDDYRILQECYQTYSEVKEKGNDFIKALEYFQHHLALRDSLAMADELAAGEKEQRVKYYEALEQKLLLDISDEDLRFLTIRSLRADSLSMQSELRALRSDSLSKHSEIMALRATADLKASEQQRLRQAFDLELERHKTEQQQRDIQTLEQEKRIADLTLKAQEDEQQRLLQQVELEKAKRKTAIVIVVLAILIALMILASLIYSRVQNKKLEESKKQIEDINLDLEKKNTEISEQKEVIEQKNKAITDSILYASRIQSAVLAPTTFMNEWGISNFIFFMPKDIVSGDFYWGTRKKGKMIIAAADCTGHGVPGAFMSMLGNAFLNEIVNAAEHLEAAAILNSLREEVIRALKQKGTTGEARDGMDIALCILDTESMKGTFAGANNPMYMIRNSSMIKLQADRMPIGIHAVAERPFASQQFEIKKDDTLYLFTDGYADQFGGPQGKKFMYKPFQELLLSIAHEPMDRQHAILKKAFSDWQGSYEQVDDVLVMGIRV